MVNLIYTYEHNTFLAGACIDFTIDSKDKSTSQYLTKVDKVDATHGSIGAAWKHGVLIDQSVSASGPVLN